MKNICQLLHTLLIVLREQIKGEMLRCKLYKRKRLTKWQRFCLKIKGRKP